MRDEYDFSNAVRNPYTKDLKEQVVIPVDADTIDFFKTEAKRTNIPYQKLMNIVLTDCAAKRRPVYQ